MSLLNARNCIGECDDDNNNCDHIMMITIILRMVMMIVALIKQLVCAMFSYILEFMSGL